MEFETQIKDAIDREVAKYPEGKAQSAVMAALMIVQEANGGHLTESLIADVADYLNIPRIAAKEVSSFYTMYEHQPVGRYKLELCTNVSCRFRNCDAVAAHLKQKLGIEFGQTTPDGRFTLKEVECLGACIEAPVMQVGQTYHGYLTPESVDTLLDKMK